MRVERFGFPVLPVFPEQFNGVLGANGTVAAEHGVGRAVFVTAPADALGVFGVGRDLLGHAVGAARAVAGFRTPYGVRARASGWWRPTVLRGCSAGG